MIREWISRGDIITPNFSISFNPFHFKSKRQPSMVCQSFKVFAYIVFDIRRLSTKNACVGSKSKIEHIMSSVSSSKVGWLTTIFLFLFSDSDDFWSSDEKLGPESIKMKSPVRKKILFIENWGLARVKDFFIKPLSRKRVLFILWTLSESFHQTFWQQTYRATIVIA